MPKPLGNSGRYMPGIDGLRAIAVFAVIAYHLNLSWVPGGLLGVGIFFVLSGYLITDILLKQQSHTKRLNLGEFWIRRARRLLPAMVIMLLLVAAWLLYIDPARLSSLKGEMLSALIYTSNWRLIFHQVSYFESFGPPSPFGHLWSLAVEEQFYLVWPLLLVLLVRWVPQRGKLALVILAGAAASAGLMAALYVPGLDPSRVYYGTDTRAFALLIGAALAVIWPSWKLSEYARSKTKMVLDIVGFSGLAVVLAMIATVGEYDEMLYRGGMVVLSVATAAVVASLAHPSSRFGRVMGCKPLRWLGVRSYGIYLYHYPIIALTTPTAEVDEFHAMRAVLQVAAAIVLAEFSWRFVEEPIRRGALGRLRGKLSQLAARQRQSLRASRIVLVMSLCTLMAVSVSCSTQLYAIDGGLSVGIPILKPGITNERPTGDQADHAVSEGGTEDRPVVTKPNDTQPGDTTANDTKAGDTASNDTNPGDLSPSEPESGVTDSSNTNPGDAGVVTDTEPEENGTSPDQPVTSKPGKAGSAEDKPDNGAKDQDNAKGNGANKPPATHPPSKPSKPLKPIKPAAGSVTVIGDSILLDAKPYLEELVKGIVVDGKVGRQMSEADEVVLELKEMNRLGQTVIIELGTNGSFTEKQLNTLLTAIGSEHKVILVNTRVPRKWQDVVNGMLAETVTKTPGISLIDWYSASKGQDGFFSTDGVHLKKNGAQFFAQLLVDALAKT
ncbi:acyltransferase family protein [Paenibacillus sp. CF384]|uniref:acyltransferase family protein n=1 Tax=Paenibacillus sp. CF384 TaxID=1884382 RepID=UPI00089825FB|nr:acyltransferase family protein [Paenibacillus sp. CF384]SDX76213.1 Peptidoglycan/LPS O-acetylase OafA/YrhL, contains acyltransferase and SGNH-hydrolase domains [Paenibacillus sp. CF384]